MLGTLQSKQKDVYLEQSLGTICTQMELQEASKPGDVLRAVYSTWDWPPPTLQESDRKSTPGFNGSKLGHS